MAAAKTVQLVVRVEPSVAERADRIAERVGEAGKLGLQPSRSDVIREAIDRGLSSMEAEQSKRPKR